jgi:hypothetical protein
VRTILLVSALAALVLPGPGSHANEPQGLILFEAEDVKPAPEGAPGFEPGEKVVTLVIRSSRSLRGAVLIGQLVGLACEAIGRRGAWRRWRE